MMTMMTTTMMMVIAIMAAGTMGMDASAVVVAMAVGATMAVTVVATAATDAATEVTMVVAKATSYDTESIQFLKHPVERAINRHTYVARCATYIGSHFDLLLLIEVTMLCYPYLHRFECSEAN